MQFEVAEIKKQVAEMQFEVEKRKCPIGWERKLSKIKVFPADGSSIEYYLIKEISKTKK